MEFQDWSETDSKSKERTKEVPLDLICKICFIFNAIGLGLGKDTLKEKKLRRKK